MKYLRKLKLKEIMWLFWVLAAGHKEHVVIVSALDLKHLGTRGMWTSGVGPFNASHTEVDVC